MIESIYENNIKEYGKNACVLMRSGKGWLKLYIVSIYREKTRRKVLKCYQQWATWDGVNKLLFMNCFNFIFETVPWYVAQADHELAVLLFLPHVLGLQECATIPGYFKMSNYEHELLQCWERQSETVWQEAKRKTLGNQHYHLSRCEWVQRSIRFAHFQGQ